MIDIRCTLKLEKNNIILTFPPELQQAFEDNIYQLYNQDRDISIFRLCARHQTGPNDEPDYSAEEMKHAYILSFLEWLID